MKALWLARLARPDIFKSINDLATKVQKWTRVHDKKLLRLIQYLQHSLDYRLTAVCEMMLMSCGSNCSLMPTLAVTSRTSGLPQVAIWY